VVPFGSERTADGRLVYHWRAVDAEREVLDVLVQTRRNKRAARKLMRKLLKKYGFVRNRGLKAAVFLKCRNHRDHCFAHRRGYASPPSCLLALPMINEQNSNPYRTILFLRVVW
jgi:DDE domain